jgi:hypothetical protein
VQRDGEAELPTGEALGDLSSELKPGEWIVDFCCVAPKTYIYITNSGDVVSRVKGFTIDRQVRQSIHFDTLLDLIYGPPGETITIDYPCNMTRNKRTMAVACGELSKRMKMTYTNRVVMPDMRTLPHGHEDIK